MGLTALYPLYGYKQERFGVLGSGPGGGGLRAWQAQGTRVFTLDRD